MDIVSRLKKFLSVNNISSSQFADTCDIPRPTVSQLLNGRNKKVSDEVISKIHSSYPALSIMWLMFGEEPMMVDNRSGVIHNNENLSPAEHQESLKFTDETKHSPEKTNVTDIDKENKIVFPLDEEPNFDNEEHVNVSQNTIYQAIENLTKQNNTQAQISNGNNKKKIVNVMIFYSDKSFESFVPDKM